MAIKEWGIGEGQGIEAYKQNDPYEFSIDNRPLKNLVGNDVKIDSQIQSMVPKYPISSELPNGTRRIFTLPDGEKAVPGSFEVHINGNQYNPLNIMMISGNTQFEISSNDIIPDGADSFYFLYRVVNDFEMQTEELNYEVLSNYIGQLDGRRIIRGSLRFYINTVVKLKDDLNGNIIKISDNSFVGEIDYDSGDYDFTYDFYADESGTDYQSGDLIEVKYQNYTI